MGCLQWTANQYTITFDTDGGSDVAAITQDYGTAVTATVTKDGRILLKWNEVKGTDKYVIYRVNTDGKLVKAGTTTKTAARIVAKSTDTGYVVRASVNGKLTAVTKSDIVTAE